MQQLEEVDVQLGLGAKVLLEEDVDVCLEQEAVIDRIHLHVRQQVPAHLPAARLGCVHDVIHHEEHRLQPLDCPAEGGGAAVLDLRQSLQTFDLLVRRDHCEATGQLALRHVVIHHALQVVGSARRQVVLSNVREQLLIEAIENNLEVLRLITREVDWEGVRRKLRRSTLLARQHAGKEHDDEEAHGGHQHLLVAKSLRQDVRRDELRRHDRDYAHESTYHKRRHPYRRSACFGPRKGR
mmetsp:Transcript_45147/g.118460  ORF Transcript_45147/g.118460 Transcript_45147/m.118460 type:complete len:239 (-) Transcript_45147:16-732(-)